MCLFGIDREPLIVAEVTHLFLMQSFHLESLLLKKKKKNALIMQAYAQIVCIKLIKI